MPQYKFKEPYGKYPKDTIVEGNFVTDSSKSEANYVLLTDGSKIPFGNKTTSVIELYEATPIVKQTNVNIASTGSLEVASETAMTKINNATSIGGSLGFVFGLMYAFNHKKAFIGYVGYSLLFSIVGATVFRVSSYFINRNKK